MMKCADPPPKTTVYKSLQMPKTKVGSTHLEQVSTKGLWSDWDIKATYKCSRFEGGFSVPEKVKGPVPKPNSVGY